MIKIEYATTFLRDMKKMQKKNPQVYEEIKKLCFEDLPTYSTLADIPQVKKLVGYTDYYRIRIGSYRIGFKRERVEIDVDLEIKDENKKTLDKLQLLRVLHRKDIFKYFPS